MTFNTPFLKRRLVAWCWALQVIAPLSSWGADLSTMSDFGRDEIVRGSASVKQNGSGNFANVAQTVNDGGTTGHYIELTQSGSDNQATTEQFGDLNRIRIDQNSSSNIANVLQEGSGNAVDLIQSGDWNRLYVSQIGNNNNIVFLQPGSATANLVEKGDNNLINVSQGFGSTINIRLEGNNLTATVRQN